MSSPRIIAIDPGAVTGWAEFREGRPLRTLEIAGRHSVYEEFIWGTEESWYIRGDTEVVCEDYIISARTVKVTPQKDPLYIIGWLEGECHRCNIPFTLQTPSQAKSFATDDKLKYLGWYTPTKDGHANDASRHLLTYLVNKYPKVGRDLLKGFL